MTSLLGASVPLPRGVIGGANEALAIAANGEALLRAERAALRALGVSRRGVALPESEWHRCDIAADAFAEAALVIVAARTFDVDQLSVAVGRAPLGLLTARPIAVVDVGDGSQTAEALGAQVGLACEAAAAHGPWLLDAIARTPSLRQSAGAPPVGPLVAIDHDAQLSRDPFAPVHMVAAAGRPTLWLAASHFDHAAAFDFAERVQAASRAARDEPAAALRDIDALTARDRALLTALNDTAGPVLPDATVPAAFRTQVERTPHDPAVTAGGVSFSYVELAARVGALRRGLLDAGLSRGSRVGLCLSRGEHLVPSVLAVLECGAAYVPLDPTYPVERLQYMVDDAGLDLLLSDQSGAAAVAGRCPGFDRSHGDTRGGGGCVAALGVDIEIAGALDPADALYVLTPSEQRAVATATSPSKPPPRCGAPKRQRSKPGAAGRAMPSTAPIRSISKPPCAVRASP